MRNTGIIIRIFLLLNNSLFAQEWSDKVIWNTGKYSAFTSLLHTERHFYCAFREASQHRAVLNNSKTMGEIVIITSKDGVKWEPYTRIKEANCDLRDPKISMTPNGKMMLLFCRINYYDNKQGNPASYVSFIDLKNKQMMAKVPIVINDYEKPYKWLWEVVWHKGEAYGFMYGNDFLFLKSKDGVKYDILSKLRPGDEKVTETSLLFKEEEVVALARGKENKAIYGQSKFPYNMWEWSTMNIAVGGPSLIELPDGKLLLGTRNYETDCGMTSLYWVNNKNAIKIVTLNKNRDSSYPSFAIVGGNLYISYYSGNHHTTSIRLAEISLNSLTSLIDNSIESQN